jgi:hypothetical protein
MQQRPVTIPIFSARTLAQTKEDLGAADFELTHDQMVELTRVRLPAVQSIKPCVGAYPYPMLEYGSPALPEFYSRYLLFGQAEQKIINHRRVYPFQYQRPETPAAPPAAKPAVKQLEFAATC